MLNILSEPSDLDGALRQGLQILLQEAGCAGGALFFLKNLGAPDLQWITQDVSAEWESLIYRQESPLNRSVMEILNAGQFIPGLPASDLLGGIPLSINGDIYGGVLFYGRVAKSLAIEHLNLVARPLTFLISRCLTAADYQANINPAILDLAVNIQDITIGLPEIINRVSDGIQKLMAPDCILLYLYYPEKDHFVEKKCLSRESTRVEQFPLNDKPSLLKTCLHSKEIMVVPNLAGLRDYNLEIDGVGDLEPRSAICVPMLASGLTVGAIHLLFVKPPALTPPREHLLSAIANSFASAILSARLVQQLRVANADIEANQWEVIRSRNTLRALFDSLPASIYIIDQSYKLIAVNMSRSNRTSDHPAHLVGKNCYEALYERTEACAGCLVNETLFMGTGTLRNSRVWVNAQPIDWEITTYAILNDRNQPSQAIVLEQDITEKRRLEAHVVQAEKLAAVGQLAAGVAHEINNPLAAVIANAQILSRELAGDEDKLESLKLIELAGVRAAQVVKNLLGLARKEQYEFEYTDLNDTIHTAVRLVQHELVSRSVHLSQDLAKDMPAILASRDHLQGVWINLIMNALDAMEGQDAHLSINTIFANNEFRVTISDNGQGIPPERISRIFEPFYTTKTPGRGTGLGLSVCHRTVKHHGGYIIVDSQVGAGTQFTVVLPGGTTPSQPKP